MPEIIQVITNHCYRVPAPTASEEKLSELRNQLFQRLEQPEKELLDEIGELEVDTVCDAAEDAFMQGLLAGIELVCKLCCQEEKLQYHTLSALCVTSTPSESIIRRGHFR